MSPLGSFQDIDVRTASIKIFIDADFKSILYIYKLLFH